MGYRAGAGGKRFGAGLVTSRRRGLHPSQVREETNPNYSVIFPWWDRLHRTLRLNVPQSAIAIGVPAYTEPGDNKLTHVFKLPFLRQRDYWLHQPQYQKARNPKILGQDRPRMANLKEAAG